MDPLKGDQLLSTVEEESAPKVHRSIRSKAGESKADARYWMQGDRLRFHGSADYALQIQAERRRVWFSTGTPNRKKAASKAAEIYSFIKSHGLAAAEVNFKPKGETGGIATVGAVIKSAASLSSARSQTLEAYSKALRCIAAEIKGIELEKDENGKGRDTAAWRARVDAISLSELPPAEILAWKNGRLREAGGDALKKGRAIVTVNSLMRNAKSLFGKKLLPFMEQSLVLPRPLPFDGIGFEKSPSMRYVSRIDPFAILARARVELSEEDIEAYKVLILALVCGLRRSEIDNLLWRAFDFPRKILRAESSEYHELKSADSAGEIDLDADLVALFRSLRAKAPTAVFVIDCDAMPLSSSKKRIRKSKPSKETKSRTYRCDAIFARVLTWLRAQGVDASKPLHTMRKEIGSIIASEHGIFEASRYLRHSDIRITAAIYTDKKKTITPATFDGILRDVPSRLSNE